MLSPRLFRTAVVLTTFLTGAVASSVALAQAGKDLVIGFANAKSGWVEAYDTPARRAAMIRIDEINAAGGLMGRHLKVVETDTKSDRAQSAKAGLEALDQGAELLVVSCDYDFGSPAALQAQKKGKLSFFLCAEDIKAGIQGVGKNSFSSSVLAAVQGATMAEWAVAKRNVKLAYVLLDTTIEYDKGICTGTSGSTSCVVRKHPQCDQDICLAYYGTPAVCSQACSADSDCPAEPNVSGAAKCWTFAPANAATGAVAEKYCVPPSRLKLVN